jgi:hypothetical protein
MLGWCIPATVACLALPGCTTTEGTSPQPSAAARVSAFAGNAQFCGQADTPICEARVTHVDGERILTFDAALVAPGRRRLGIFCRINLSIMIGDAQTFQREIEATLEAGKRYRVEARMDPEPCTVTLTEER